MARNPKLKEIMGGFKDEFLWRPPEPQISYLKALNNPTFVNVQGASHMRDDDYVVGVVYGETARAYPYWIVDYYHGVNDMVGDDPMIVFS